MPRVAFQSQGRYEKWFPYETNKREGRDKQTKTTKKSVGRRAGHFKFGMMEWMAIDRLAMLRCLFIMPISNKSYANGLFILSCLSGHDSLLRLNMPSNDGRNRQTGKQIKQWSVRYMWLIHVLLISTLSFFSYLCLSHSPFFLYGYIKYIFPCPHPPDNQK